MMTRRLPHRTPRPVPVPRALPVPDVTSVELTGRLVGVEGMRILEILHLDLSGTDQYEAQMFAAQLINHQVRITVALVETATVLPHPAEEFGEMPAFFAAALQEAARV